MRWQEAGMITNRKFFKHWVAFLFKL
jgi:hypothetical protein